MAATDQKQRQQQLAEAQIACDQSLCLLCSALELAATERCLVFDTSVQSEASLHSWCELALSWLAEVQCLRQPMGLKLQMHDSGAQALPQSGVGALLLVSQSGSQLLVSQSLLLPW